MLLRENGEEGCHIVVNEVWHTLILWGKNYSNIIHFLKHFKNIAASVSGMPVNAR
jgi:hypothetical protein